MKKGVLITILVIVLFLVLLVLGVGYVYMQLNREPYVAENSILTIDFDGPIVEFDQSVLSRNLSIKELWFHLQRAKIDPRITGILMKISSINAGLAKIEDIGKFIKDFRESGKKVTAFIESGGIKEYYLATFADKVYLFKGGFLFLKGLAVESMFLKNTLQKLGIKAQLLHIGEYKTAANLFTEEQMTPPHRESLEKLVEDIYQSTLEGIAARRGLDLAAVKQVFAESPITNQSYLEAKLIDGILYEDEIFNESNEDLNKISFDLYRETTSPTPYKGINKIAVIFASGEIHSGKSGSKSIFGDEVLGSDTAVEYLKAVRRNRFVKAVVLRVNSPGGSALASDAIRREAELLAREKPLVISMSDLAASGGYWLSMSTPHIMALPQTITGSIGVLSGKFILKELYDKIGINKEMIKTSPYADMFWDYREFTPEEQNKMMTMMETLYRTFLEIVAKNRNMTTQDVDKIARGRVWSGSSALDLKLVEKMGGLNDALAEARTLAKIPTDERVGIKIYPKKRSFFDMIFELVGAKAKTGGAVLEVDTDPLHSLATTLNRYKKFFPALMMPYKVSIQ
jgi:protease-4